MTRSLVRTLLLLITAAIALGAAPPSRKGGEPAASKSAEPAYALVPTTAQRVRADLLIVLKGPKIQADEWAVFVVMCPELPSQPEVRTTLLVPPGRPGRELSELGRPILIGYQSAESVKDRHELTIQIEYEAVLVKRKLVRRESGEPGLQVVPPLDPKTLRQSLKTGRLFDFDAKPFRDWLDEKELRRKPEEGEIDFARRVFEMITTQFTHFEAEKLDRWASQVCQAGKSDRHGLSSLFVSALRANKVPARVLVGHQVRSTAMQPDKRGYDVQTSNAEFFAPGVGWVPAEIPEGVFAKTLPEKLEHFGDDTGYFLAVHVDPDIVYDSFFNRETTDFLPQAAWSAKGSGSFQGLSSKQGMKVETEPLDLDEYLSRKPPARPATTTVRKKKR